MKQIKKQLCIFFLNSVLLTILPVDAFSLRDAESRALEKNPAIQISREEQNQNKLRYSQAFLSWFPDLTFGSMAAVLQKSQKISEFQRQKRLFSNQLTLTQPIFSSTLLENLHLSHIDIEQGEAAQNASQVEVIYRVRLNYLLLALKSFEKEVQQKRCSILEEKVQDEEIRYKAGSTTALSIVKAKAQLSEQMARTFQTQKDKIEAQRELAVLLYYDDSEAKALSVPILPLPHEYPLLRDKLEQLKNNLSAPDDLFSAEEISYWLELAHLNDPDIKKSALYVKTAEVKKAQSRSQYLPELSAFVDYGYYQPVNGQFFKQRNQWAGGLQLSWSLFDSLKREMKSKEASAYSKASKIALHYAQNRLNQTIQNDLETIAQALFVYYSTQKSLEVAEKMAEESRISYQAGRLSTYESQESTLFLLQSQLKYQESWAQVLKSYYQLLHDTGLVSELLL